MYSVAQPNSLLPYWPDRDADDDHLVLGFGRKEPKPWPRRPIRPPEPRHVLENGGEQISGDDHLSGRVPPPVVAP